MTSDRTAPPALPFFLLQQQQQQLLFFACSFVFTTNQPTRCGSAAIDMRCMRRPRLGMGWLRSLLSPLRKLWCRVNAVQRKKRGIYILYDDVKSCQCEDVHVLWSILVESHGLPPPTPMPSPPVLSLKR